MAPLLLLLALAAGTSRAAPAGTTLEREFRYPADRVSVTRQGGAAVVRFAGALRQPVPGRPDVPVVSELVELPEATRVTAVEVVDLDGQPLPGSVWVPPARRPTTNPAAPEPAAPDPAAYGRAGFGPDVRAIRPAAAAPTGSSPVASN